MKLHIPKMNYFKFEHGLQTQQKLITSLKTLINFYHPSMRKINTYLYYT